MANNITIDSETLEDLALGIDTLIDNNSFLLGSIRALQQKSEIQKLCGVEIDLLEKLEFYEQYFSRDYEQMLDTMQDNIYQLATAFEEQDSILGKELS